MPGTYEVFKYLLNSTEISFVAIENYFTVLFMELSYDKKSVHK